MKLEFLSFEFDKFAAEMQNLKDKKGFVEDFCVVLVAGRSLAGQDSSSI